VTRYVSEGGTAREGGRGGSVWWRNVESLPRVEGLTMGRRFNDNLVRVVGDGTRTFYFGLMCG